MDACSTDGMGQKDRDERGLTRISKIISTRCEMEDGNTQMRWGKKIRSKSGGADGNVEMDVRASPQG